MTGGTAAARPATARTRWRDRAMVEAMVHWARAQTHPAPVPARVIDPGCGSGRFLMAAARSFPKAQLIGVEVDPLAALMARANLSRSSCADPCELTSTTMPGSAWTSGYAGLRRRAWPLRISEP